MNFRISCDNNAEEVAISFLNELNQVSGVAESVLNRLPVRLSVGRITSERQDVSNASLFCTIKSADNEVTCHTSACDMHQHVKAHIVHNMAAHFNCRLAKSCTSSPGDINPQRIGRAHPCDSINEVFLTYNTKSQLNRFWLLTCSSLWWEILITIPCFGVLLALWRVLKCLLGTIAEPLIFLETAVDFIDDFHCFDVSCFV